jgi:hypothetical protein
VNGFAGPLLSGLSDTAHLVGSAVLGGAASVIGGGKFADGAVTAAFAYLVSPRGGIGDSQTSPLGGALADDTIADTRVTWDGRIVVTHYPIYNTLSLPEQLAVDAHEGVHVEQLLPYVNQGWVGAVEAFFYQIFNRAALEIPAYTKELTFIQNYRNEFNPVPPLSIALSAFEFRIQNNLQYYCSRLGSNKPSGC